MLMAMRIIAPSAISLVLSACASTPDPIVEDRSRCDAYANCVMTAARDRQKRDERQADRQSYSAPQGYGSPEE